MPNFWDKGLGTSYAGGSYVDPAGIFAPGGLLGGAKSSSSAEAQAAFLQRMMGRESDLWPQIQAILGKSGENADAEYQAATGEANRLYPQVQSDIQNYTMSPEALAALDKIRQSRIDSIGNDTNNLIGSKIADYARRGVTSSSTAEGMGREVTKAIAPTINQADQDYWQARLTQPKEQAMARYGLAVGQGQLNASALKDKYTALLQPYLDMWKTSAGVGSQNPAFDPNSNKSAENLGAIAKIVGSFV